LRQTAQKIGTDYARTEINSLFFFQFCCDQGEAKGDKNICTEYSDVEEHIQLPPFTISAVGYNRIVVNVFSQRISQISAARIPIIYQDINVMTPY
jgi:hypothetical protein